MKQQKFFGIILVICVLVTLTGCASATTFDGSRVKNADSYQLDIKTMNCTDTHTLELEQGDTLKIEFETENGNLSMKITAPDGTELYQGDGTVKEFTVEAPMDGAYPIVVVGQKAKGSIHIDVERVPETGRGGVEIVSFENVNITYPEHTHIEPGVISGVRFVEIISVKR